MKVVFFPELSGLSIGCVKGIYLESIWTMPFPLKALSGLKIWRPIKTPHLTHLTAHQIPGECHNWQRCCDHQASASETTSGLPDFLLPNNRNHWRYTSIAGLTNWIVQRENDGEESLVVHSAFWAYKYAYFSVVSTVHLYAHIWEV